MIKHVPVPFDRYGSDDYFRVAEGLANLSEKPFRGSLVEKEIETGIRYFVRKYGLKISEIFDFDTVIARVEARSEESENGLSDLGFLVKFRARSLSQGSASIKDVLQNEFEALLREGPLAYFSWACPREKTVLAASANAERVFGRAPESFSAGSTEYFELIHPDDVETVKNDLSEFLRSRSGEFDLHYRIVQPSWQVRFVRDHTRVIYDEDGEMLQSYGFVLDVTDREESRFVMDEYVRAIDQSAIVQIVDREGMVVYVNDLYRKVSGDTREIVGKPVRILGGRKYHDQEFWENLWSTVLEGKIWSGVVQNPLPRDPSESYYAYTTITPACNARGEYDRFIAIKFDVTRLKEVESALREANARFEKIIDSTSQGFWSLDRDLRISEVNSSLCRMLWYSREELLGKDLRELFDEKNREILEAQAKNVATTDHRKYDLEILRKDGASLPIMINATSLRAEDGTFSEAVAFVTDSTEAKAFQTRLYLASITDELTQTGNRRHFDKELALAFDDLVHWRIPNLSLIVLDLDNFKRINDSFGHDNGDKVLRFIGNKLGSLSNSKFSVFRLGGEEFGILGKGISLDLMREVAESLRKDIQRSPVDIGAQHPLRISISAWVASLDSAQATEHAPVDLYRSADALLYLAKNSGRNNVKAQTIM